MVHIAATLILGVQPVVAQDRSEEYEQGYRDAVCDLFRDLAPLLLFFVPMAVASDSETSMADFMVMADECGIDWAETASQSTAALTPEPPDPVRCERLAALIPPLDDQVDRLLAADPSNETSLEISRTQRRRNEIEDEMERADC